VTTPTKEKATQGKRKRTASASAKAGDGSEGKGEYEGGGGGGNSASGQPSGDPKQGAAAAEGAEYELRQELAQSQEREAELKERVDYLNTLVAPT